MSVRKVPTKIITETSYPSLAAGASTVLAKCLATDLGKATQCVVSVAADSVPAGTMTITLYASFDGLTYDNSPWEPNAAWAGGWVTPSGSVSATSPEIPPLVRYLKFVITNNHGTSSITNLRAFVTVQLVG